MNRDVRGRDVIIILVRAPPLLLLLLVVVMVVVVVVVVVVVAMVVVVVMVVECVVQSAMKAARTGAVRFRNGTRCRLFRHDCFRFHPASY